MSYGKVKWFNTAKGYGFIERDGEQDVFVHYSCINQDGFRDLKQGQTVSFEIIDTDKGPQAREVTLVDGRSPNTETADRFIPTQTRSQENSRSKSGPN